MNIKTFVYIFVYHMIWNKVHKISIYWAAIFGAQQSSGPHSLQINMERSSMNILRNVPFFKIFFFFCKMLL